MPGFPVDGHIYYYHFPFIVLLKAYIIILELFYAISYLLLQKNASIIMQGL